MIEHHNCDLISKQDWFKIYKFKDKWYLKDSKSDWSTIYYCPWCGAKL